MTREEVEALVKATMHDWFAKPVTDGTSLAADLATAILAVIEVEREKAATEVRCRWCGAVLRTGDMI